MYRLSLACLTFWIFSYPFHIKTLQSMLASVKKGKPINEEEIPPPVATGGKPNVPPVQPEPIMERPQPAPQLTPSPPDNQKPLREAPAVMPNAKHHFLTPPKTPSAAITPDTPAISPLTPCPPDSQNSGTLTHTHTHIYVCATAFCSLYCLVNIPI